jgi:hypothetical protein
MADERPIDARKSVREVIIDLLLLTLPVELRAAAPELADRVAEHPDVAPHYGKRWGDVAEGQACVIAREAGVIARDIAIGAGSTTQSGGEHLH